MAKKIIYIVLVSIIGFIGYIMFNLNETNKNFLNVIQEDLQEGQYEEVIKLQTDKYKLIEEDSNKNYYIYNAINVTTKNDKTTYTEGFFFVIKNNSYSNDSKDIIKTTININYINKEDVDKVYEEEIDVTKNFQYFYINVYETMKDSDDKEINIKKINSINISYYSNELEIEEEFTFDSSDNLKLKYESNEYSTGYTYDELVKMVKIPWYKILIFILIFVAMYFGFYYLLFMRKKK